MTESTIYWVLKLDDIQMVLGGLVMLTGLLTAALVITYLVTFSLQCDENDKKIAQQAKKYILPSCIAFVLFSLAGTFLPSTKQMAMIKVIPMIANSEVVGEMSADAKEIYKLGINAIKESLGGLSK